MKRTGQRPLRIPRLSAGDYSHFQAVLAWSPDHRSLHLSCRLHADRGTSETVAYMRCDNFGQTCHRRDGAVIELPATTTTMDVIAPGGRSEGLLSHKCGSIAVDLRSVPYILYSTGNESTSEMVIAASDDRMGWKQTSLARQWPSWQIEPAATSMAFDKQGTMFATATLSRENKSDIVLLVSYDDGDSFSMIHLSSHLPCDRKWWPNLERPTDHNAITERPGVLFTTGSRREGSDDILSNDGLMERFELITTNTGS